MAVHIPFYDIYRMVAGEQTAYNNYSSSLGDTNLDTLATGRGRFDIANGAIPNTTEYEEKLYELQRREKKPDTNNMVDGTRLMSTSNPIIAAKAVNAMYNYAGESQEKYLCEGGPGSGRIKSGLSNLAHHVSTNIPLVASQAVNTLSQFAGASYAEEGGQGSGRDGHKKWMRGAEYGSSYKECPNCEVISAHENGKCSICGETHD